MKKLTFATLLALLPFSAAGLHIHDYEDERHLRFNEGSFPAAPQPNETLWVGRHNFAGVGWSEEDPRKGFALISPRHFVGANHFRPALGSEVRFRGLDGQLRSYTYTRFYQIKNAQGENTDLFIGELAEEIPAAHGVPLYAIFDSPESELVGREIIVYGQSAAGPRIGRGEIGVFSDSFNPGSSLNDTRNYAFDYRDLSAEQDDAHGEVGDSGSPSFLAVDGMLALTGIHSTVNSVDLPGTGAVVTTYDSYILHYKEQINAHLAETGHQLILAPLDEGELTINGLERAGDGVLLQVENASQLPYDVERTSTLGVAGWETVATSETGATWTGSLPSGFTRAFWRLHRYPLPLDQDE